jgi:hypothetical protein
VLVREIDWDEVIHAGTVIFGATFAAAAHAGAWRGDLKNAYRRRVLETHPDRAAVLGRSEADLLAEFRAVSEAYALLGQLRAGPLPSTRAPPPPPGPARAHRASPPRSPPSPRRPAPEPPRRAAPPPRGPSGQGRAGGASPPPPGDPPRASSASSRPAEPRPAEAQPGSAAPPRPAGPAASPFADAPRVVPPWANGLPRRRLRLAEFLYYSGRVSWQDFVAAIAWQRGQRPTVGRIAVGFGFLDRWEVAEILERRRIEGAGREPFGEFAVRHGYLTPFQLLALLGQQLRLQQPIGRFFVERGLVDDADLDRARAVVFRHNARHAA